MVESKLYLGDSVYVKNLFGCELILTTENGIGVTNTIILEEDVMDTLVDYYLRLKEEAYAK